MSHFLAGKRKVEKLLSRVRLPAAGIQRSEPAMGIQSKIPPRSLAPSMVRYDATLTAQLNRRNAEGQGKDEAVWTGQ